MAKPKAVSMDEAYQMVEMIRTMRADLSHLETCIRYAPHRPEDVSNRQEAGARILDMQGKLLEIREKMG